MQSEDKPEGLEVGLGEGAESSAPRRPAVSVPIESSVGKDKGMKVVHWEIHPDHAILRG